MSTDLENKSLAERLLKLSPEAREKALAELSPTQTSELLHDWTFWARKKQLPPEGDWATWAVIAGRAFGKTLTGSSWIHKRAMEERRWIALIARTPADARDYMIEGPSGLVHRRLPAPPLPPSQVPKYEPSKRRLTWPNGSWATVYSDDEPDQIRGFSGDTAWLDEFAKYKNPREVWDNLEFGMREASSDRPRRLITTTPRPLAILRHIIGLPTTRLVTGSSYENRANLDPTWFRDTLMQYEGTRLGRQEINAEILDDVIGALWGRETLERAHYDHHTGRRLVTPPVKMRRVVVGLDPSGSDPGMGRGESARSSAGIIVVGLGEDGLAYVLADETCSASPDTWARKAISALVMHEGDVIVAERNFGGEMVRAVLQTVDPNVPVRLVHASRGKTVRAEPVSTLYEQGKVKHVGMFNALEDQMCLMSGDPQVGFVGDGSPDRVDALVWALVELMLKRLYETPIGIGGKVFVGGEQVAGMAGAGWLKGV